MITPDNKRIFLTLLLEPLAQSTRYGKVFLTFKNTDDETVIA